MRDRLILLLLPLLVAIASTAQAQVVPEPVVSWDVEFWAAGVNPATGTPITVQNFTYAGATCNLPLQPVPTTPVDNPTKIFVDDPKNPGRSCQMGPTTSAGLLASLPVQAAMFATYKAKGATTTAARSAASNPFNNKVTAPPQVATGVAVTQ